MNEADFLDWLGVFDLLDTFPRTNSKYYRKRKSENELQLWQRSIDPWDSEICSADFKSSVEVMTATRINIGVEDLEYYNDNFLPAFLIYMIIVIVLLSCHICSKLNPCTWQIPLMIDDPCMFPCHNIWSTFIVVFVSIGVILEAITIPLSAVYYDTDHIGEFRAPLTPLIGCGGPNLDLALQLLENKNEERPGI